MEFKITKVQALRENANDMVGHQWYYIVNCRVYPDSTHKSFWRRRFVMMFDSGDLADYYHDEEQPEVTPKITNQMIKDYKNEMAYCMADSIIGCSSSIQDVTRGCNETINHYNDVYAA